MLSYLLKKQKSRFCLYVLFTIISSVLEIMLAYVMSACVELALSGELSRFARYGLMFAIYVVLDGLGDYLTKYLRASVLRKAQEELRNDLTKRILCMNQKAFHAKNTGDWVSTLANDVEMVGQSYFSTVLLLLPDIISFALSLVCVCYISLPIALFILALTAIQMLIPKLLAPYISSAKEVQSACAADYTITATEHLQGFDLLQSFHLTAQSCVSLCRANKAWEDAKFRCKYLNALAKSLAYGFSQVIYVGLYFFGAFLIVKGYMTLGSLIAVTQLSVYIISPLQTFSADFAEIISSRKIIESLNDLAQNQEMEREWLEPPTDFQRLTVENVSFGYGDTKVLSDISYSFEKGKKYILSGVSGSGKTTLVRLLSGSLEADEGQIKLNDIPINQLAPSDYVGFVAVCAQNTFIFDDTLRNNVALYSERYTDDEINTALEAAGFGNVLGRFDNGLDEHIGQSGQNLSGGEKQRIALARMFLIHTPLLILDESFSNLDRESMTEQLRRITANREETVIYIGHNIPQDIVDMFDTVLEIKDGRLAEILA